MTTKPANEDIAKKIKAVLRQDDRESQVAAMREVVAGQTHPDAVLAQQMLDLADSVATPAKRQACFEKAWDHVKDFMATETQRKAIANSKKTRQEKTNLHWSLSWLADAHRMHPDYDRRRLAEAARKLVALNKPEIPSKKRDEITEHRARVFLESQRKQ